jgi:hypothetical protein
VEAPISNNKFRLWQFFFSLTFHDFREANASGKSVVYVSVLWKSQVDCLSCSLKSGPDWSEQNTPVLF